MTITHAAPSFQSTEGSTPARRSPGRKPGSGAFWADDAPLWQRMHELCQSGAAVSANAAAELVVDEARRRGTRENAKERLAKGYRARYHEPH